MKMQMEISEEQLSLIIKSLEVTFRTMMHQGSIVADLLAEMPLKRNYDNEEKWIKAFDEYLIRRECAKNILDSLSDVLYKDRTRVPDDCHRICDMWSAFRHSQYELHPHDDCFDIRAREPLQMSDYEMIKVDIGEK